MTEAEFKKLEQRVTQFLQHHQFERKNAHSLYEWEGQFADIGLRVSLTHGSQSASIFMRWSDPSLAQTRRGDQVNPYSGKDNFHLRACTADEAFQLFQFAVVRGASLCP